MPRSSLFPGLNRGLIEGMTPPVQVRAVGGRSVVPAVAVALATFLVVTSEMMPVGVLTPIARDLAVSTGLAGTSLTITGLVAAVVCVFAPVFARRADRRSIMVGFMVVLAAANVLTAVAPNFAVLAAARVLLGVAMGMVWGLAAGLAVRLVEPRRVPVATTLIFSGVSIASVLGVPLGTFVAEQAGWRAAFWILGVLGLLTAGVLRLLLPPLPAGAEPARLSRVFGVLRIRGVAVGLAITGLVVFGHFTGYTYVRPLLESQFGLAAGTVALALLVYGVAGVAGNFGIGPVAGRYPKPAVLLAVGGVTVAALLIAADLTSSTLAAFALLVLWGAGYGGVSVSTQSWIAAASPAHIEASSALWSGVFNASIALGAVVGGRALDSGGSTSAMWAAAVIAAVALLLAVLQRPGRPAPRAVPDSIRDEGVAATTAATPAP